MTNSFLLFYLEIDLQKLYKDSRRYVYAKD